jgi:hypothetical protein
MFPHIFLFLQREQWAYDWAEHAASSDLTPEDELGLLNAQAAFRTEITHH